MAHTACRASGRLDSAGGHRFGLTPDQREALVLALNRGYFATPSEVTLDELADELDISRQALSTRIRRGNESILREVLLSTGRDAE
jgi:predicted DNA binding protein